MRVLLLAGADESEPARRLGAALAQQGHAVRLVIPAAHGERRIPGARRLTVRVPHITGERAARVFEHSQAGLGVYHVGDPAPTDPVFLSLAGLALCRSLNWAPDVLHAFGAAGGPALYWLATDGRHEPLLAPSAGVVSIATGLLADADGQARALLAHGLVPSDAPALPDAARASLLGLSVAHSDMIAVAGPTWARVLATPGQGGALGPVFAARRERVVGILPGIDLAAHNPAHDPGLAARFTPRSLARRALNKAALQRQAGLPGDGRALLVGLAPGNDASGAFARALAGLSPARSYQWLVCAEQAGAAQACLAALGVAGVPAARVPASAASLFFAGADVVLLPPEAANDGGAAPLAMRYGALPIGLGQGALADLLSDFGSRRPAIGFAVADYNSAAIRAALARAQRAHSQPRRWQARQQRALAAARALGTQQALRATLAVYRQAIQHRREALNRLAQPSFNPVANGSSQAKLKPARVKRSP